MTIILFLIDTSASMNQRTYLGTNLLDVTKGAVEVFMKIRSRDPASRGDRYMLLTFEDPPANIKAGWKENHSTFIHELKNLQATGLSTMGPALKHTFDLLNINRMQSGVDTYGLGRCPFYLEPAMIVCFTDGGRLSNTLGVHSELNLPMTHAVPGMELTKEPFRWDQRLFGITLNLPATTPPDQGSQPYIPYAENSPIDAMCDVTGGRSYAIGTQKVLFQCLESLVQKCQCGVVINFEKIGPDPPQIKADDGESDGIAIKLKLADNDYRLRSVTPTPGTDAWQNTRKLIYVPRSAQKGYYVGHWPIPEAFWPDLNSPNLPGRSSHPNVKFSCSPSEPLAMVLENLPFDKYELESSPLTHYILDRKQANVCWQVFINNSAKYSETGYPFGYLKPSTNLQFVNLIVMPYNYPVLVPLLDELFKVHKLKPSSQWRQKFENYLKSMPVYYAVPLRRALQRMGIHGLVPESMDNCLSYSVISYLKKLKNQAKLEFEYLVASVGQKTSQPEGIKVISRSSTSLLQRQDFNQLMQHYGGDLSALKEQLNQYESFTIGVPDKDVKPQSYRNPYDIPRKQLLDQIARMRANFLQSSSTSMKLQNDDDLHSIPVPQMGNYQEYLKNATQPLREIEIQPMRLHMFGNPFKVNKNLMIDEADEAMPGQQSKKRNMESPPLSPGPRKRKGPLPREFVLKRPATPSIISKPPTDEPEDIQIPEGAENISPDTNEDIKPDESLQNTRLLESKPVTVNHFGYTSDEDISSVYTANYAMDRIERQKETARQRLKEAQTTAYNTNIKRSVAKLIRTPGKDYTSLFAQLDSTQGTVDVRRSVIEDVMCEAERFKRKELVQLLEKYQQSITNVARKLQKQGRPHCR